MVNITFTGIRFLVKLASEITLNFTDRMNDNYRSTEHMKITLPDKEYPEDGKYDYLDILKTRIWAGSLMRRFNLTLGEFGKIYYGEREASGAVRNWVTGRNKVNSSTVAKVEGLLPTSDRIFHLPLYELLRDKISKKRVVQIMDEYSGWDYSRYWAFPDLDIFYPGCEDPCIDFTDLDSLFEFGGLYGFLGTLLLLRGSEVHCEERDHFLLIQYAFKTFPSFARHPDFNPHWRYFFRRLFCIHAKLLTTFVMVRPKFEIIEKQIQAEEFITSGGIKTTEDPFEIMV